jgi:hypothetical protein
MTTQMTKHGVTTTNGLGQEQYEKFQSWFSGKKMAFIQYDYRHTDGELFSCIKKTLELCRESRDKWLAQKAEAK